jgi:hypothetical protein
MGIRTLGPGKRVKLASAAMSLLLFGVLAPSASAADAGQYTPREVCGAGFTHVVAVKDLGRQGVLHLLSDGDAQLPGTYCAVTLKRTRTGVPSKTEVWLKTGRQDWVRDIGTYKYYAGPVYVRMDGSGYQYAGGHDGINWTSGLSRPEGPPVGYVRGSHHPWVYLTVFLAGQGGSYFMTHGDPVAEQLRRDPWLQDLERQVRRGALPSKGEQKKSSLYDPVRTGVRDARNALAFARGKATDDAALTFLGTYHVRWRTDPVPGNTMHRVLTFDIFNQTTTASATRIPGLCHAVRCPDPAKGLFPMQKQWIHLEHPYHLG